MLVRFPNLGSNDVIVPATAQLSIDIELTSTADAKRTLVSNIGRAIVKKLAVKFEGNEILSVDDHDIYTCYRDLWMTKSEKNNSVRQVITEAGCTKNCIKIRLNGSDKNILQTHIKIIISFH